MLNLFGSRLRTGNARRRRDDSAVRVETFQIKCQSYLWPIQFRVRATSRSSNNNVCEVCGVASREGIPQGEQSRCIRHAETVVQQSFAVAAAKVCESRCIAVVWLRANADLVGLGHVLPVIEAVIHAIRGTTITVCRLGN